MGGTSTLLELCLVCITSHACACAGCAEVHGIPCSLPMNHDQGQHCHNVQAKGIRLIQTAEQLREYLADSATSEVVMSTYIACPLLLRDCGSDVVMTSRLLTSSLPMQAKGIRLIQTAEQLREYLADSATSEVVMSTYIARPLLLRDKTYIALGPRLSKRSPVMPCRPRASADPDGRAAAGVPGRLSHVRGGHEHLHRAPPAATSAQHDMHVRP